MEINEFENWYKQNLRWLKAKARYFISSSTWGFENTDELVSITVEELLHNLSKLKQETLREYTFFVMRSCFYTVFIKKNQIRNSCYDETLDELYKPQEDEYDFNRDIIEQEKVDVIYNRAKTKQDLIVIDSILKGDLHLKQGKILPKIGLDSNQIKSSVDRLRGISKYKATGNETGRPKDYKGIAKVLDGKIIKVYPDYNTVKKDGYSTSRVNQICKGKLKTKIYKKFEWKYIYE